MAHKIDSNLTTKQLVMWRAGIDLDTADTEAPISAKYRLALEKQKAVMEYDMECDVYRVSPTASTTDLMDDIDGLGQKSVQAKLAKLSRKYKHHRIMELYRNAIPYPEH